MHETSGKIDLHIHSTASDGSLTPDRILSQAAACGLAAISITDHDTVAGVIAALEHGIPDTIQFMTGVEISAEYPPGFEADGSMHLLGYGFDPHNRPLARLLEKQQQSRSQRNPRILEKLAEAGIELEMAELAAKVGKSDIARPHIAALLVEKGHAASIDDAFDRYLGKGCPAYVDRFRISAPSAIAHIQNAGGIAALAHPGLIHHGQTGDPIIGRLEQLLTDLTAMGLGGLEVYYSGHSPEQTAAFRKLAEKFHLLPTGGSDFHGDINPDIRMGSGPGDLHVPFEVFAGLRRALSRTPASTR